VIAAARLRTATAVPAGQGMLFESEQRHHRDHPITEPPRTHPQLAEQRPWRDDLRLFTALHVPRHQSPRPTGKRKGVR
jgi:hypothetical protein